MFCFVAQSIPAFIRARTREMTAYYLPLLRKYKKHKTPISQTQVRKMCSEMFNVKAIRDDLMTLLLGYIRRKIYEGDDIIAKIFDNTIAWDSSVESIPTIFAPFTKSFVF